MFVDTHAHIYLDDFKADLDEVINNAVDQSIGRIYMPNIDSTSIDDMMEVENRYPDSTFSMMGLHPCSVKKNFEKELYTVEDWLGKRKFVGLGEIGTDLYWDKTFWEQQKEALRIQLRLAASYHIPAIIHCRESIDETIEIIEEEKTDQLCGIFHCFTGSVIQAEKIIKLGFKIGIGGVSTFKNGGLDLVIPDIELTDIVLETDSPYLAPVPFRGKRNMPSYITLVAERVAELKGIPIEQLEESTTELANRLFDYGK